MFAQGLSLVAGEPQQQSSLESIIEKYETELYNSGCDFEPIDPNSTSVKMEIACQLLSSRLIHLGADPDKILNNDLKELSNVNWSTLDKKEKKRLSRTNSKYYMNFHDVEHDTKSKHFGEEWHYTFKELRRMEWVRFKFISNRERYTIFQSQNSECIIKRNEHLLCVKDVVYHTFSTMKVNRRNLVVYFTEVRHLCNTWLNFTALWCCRIE
ncbi:unnamed protein product [Cyberlindnera jadinii]|uniref:Uncharacterized protein n=1 Tax=Cyberlindnera jadinii (strain ATCC 18201 / CBS 1600 / BCRC 20928 / JCM 3617 / NBRC 0987 / NRRL Y-1542) TaxID=983966 RepID=A0A0H5C8F0_CYBJN|nr:unnamed protein product [Cyberlindnera jadinii]